MNNDLEQFSEERLKDIIELADNPTMVSLARIALAAKQHKPTFEDWLSSRTDTIEVDCGCVTTEAFYHWLKVAYESTPQPAHTEQDGWIKCSERMPEVDEHKPIAIYTGNCIGQGMFVACYDEDGFYDYWDGVEISGISHWMPLPPPPIAAPKPESE